MTDQPTLRDRIRRAICEASGFTWLPDELMEPDEYGDHADAVLAVLPADLAQVIEQRNYWHAELMCADARIAELGRQRKEVPPAPIIPAAGVWTVWPEGEPALGHYTDEITAKLAAIEFQQDAEGPGHDFVYAWNRHGGHLELLANGDDTGFRVKREPVLGETTLPADSAELARLRAVDAAYTALVLRAHDMNDVHLIDAIAHANRETSTVATELDSTPADRAAVLREAADAIVTDNDRQMWASKPGKHWAADLLRRMADEAQQPEEAGR